MKHKRTYAASVQSLSVMWSYKVQLYFSRISPRFKKLDVSHVGKNKARKLGLKISTGARRLRPVARSPSARDHGTYLGAKSAFRAWESSAWSFRLPENWAYHVPNLFPHWNTILCTADLQRTCTDCLPKHFLAVKIKWHKPEQVNDTQHWFAQIN